MTEPSTKPYLIRAIHEWCVDNGYTPYLAVSVNKRTKVPSQFVKGGEIVLNASPMATNKLSFGNEWIEFEARFSGKVNEIMVPVEQVSAIYAKENGHGMAFEVAKPLAEVEDNSDAEISHDNLRPVSGTASLEAVPVMDNPDSASDVANKQKNDKKVDKSSTEKKKSHLTRIK
ncbi:MAG: ClpXP protease specificity-enhancing factor [Limnobacter sp.]|nr:ClpXP protease specificity-enhancing factor [Limnobacter sp.]